MYNYCIHVIAFTLFISLNINAEDWVVPELKKKQNANFKFSDKSYGPALMTLTNDKRCGFSVKALNL